MLEHEAVDHRAHSRLEVTNMDITIPFTSSGASSREHFALARKVEALETSGDIEEALLSEVSRLKTRLSSRRYTLVIAAFSSNDEQRPHSNLSYAG